MQAVVRPNPAAICQPLSKPCAAQVSVQRVVMVVAMVAVMVARSMPAQGHHALVLVANLTRCAPALT